MSTPLTSTEKNNFINIVKAAPYPGGLGEADRLESILNNYEDVATCIFRQLENFASNQAYITQALAVLNVNNLQMVGIWANNVIASPPLTDPILIVNSNYGEVILTPNITSPPVPKQLCLMNSKVGLITLTTGTILDYLYLGQSIVDSLDSSSGVLSPPSFTKVNEIRVTNLRNRPSRLNSIVYESVFNEPIVDEGAYYGGVVENPDVVCADAVTGMMATEVTKNGVLISWTPPAQYLFINPFYRKTNSKTWILTTSTDGEFVDDTGFVFRYLESDTYYDFKASVVCVNGGIADTVITTQTVCCGAGTQLSMYKQCKILAHIKTSPDPTQIQNLCNGMAIALEYPVGTTLTIPYLAGKNQLVPFIIDNANVNDVPFDPATGTFNGAASTIGSFVDGNIVEMNFSLPA